MNIQKRLSISSDYLLISLPITIFISLAVTAMTFCYLRSQKRKLSNVCLQKLSAIEQEIFLAKKRINELQQNPDQRSSEHLEESNVLDPIDFETEVKKDIAQLQYQSGLKKVTLPVDAFSAFERKYFLSKKQKKCTQYEQKQWILLKDIFEKILLFPKSKIEKLELTKEQPCNQPNNTPNSTLGTLVINITMREENFQKLFNAIACSKHPFIISSVSVCNNTPSPPLHHSLCTKDRLLPILGNETISVILWINLLDTTCLTTRVDSNKEWITPPSKQLLFISRHYAVQNQKLIDPIELPQALCPPIPNEWIIYNNLDYTNPNVLFEDKDHTGFNNLEKWLGDNPQEEPGRFASDPSDPTSHPLLWTKLRCHKKDITSDTLSLYFLGFQVNNKEKLFQIQPNTAIQTKNKYGQPIFNKKIRYAQMGTKIDGTSYKLVNYQEKHTRYKNIYYDSSELTLEHLENKKQTVLIKKTPYHPQPSSLTNVTSVKLENIIFNPPQTINLKLGDCFSLDYLLPSEGQRENTKIAAEHEEYQLVDINDSYLTLQRNYYQYKIPITAE